MVHLPVRHADTDAARGLQAALARFFAYRADVLGRDLKELFRVGRVSLLVGLAVLGLCLVASHAIARWGSDNYLGTFVGFVGESLIILGWVANWRPIEIFLYDWWPIWRRRNLYRRLAAATVIIKADDAKL